MCILTALDKVAAVPITIGRGVRRSSEAPEALQVEQSVWQDAGGGQAHTAATDP